MKLAKSILRPVRATTKGGAASLSFLCRGIRRGKKRGTGLENHHEPSSPKVTCIGQVRVKSKKRAKQCRRRIGEVSFRTAEQPRGGGDDRDKVWIRPQRLSSSSLQSSHRDQRWVHLPVSVCEALRAFRAEICCLLPCGCSCFSTRRRETAEESGCGAVFAGWLVAVNGGEGEKEREIEVVVGGDDRVETMSFRSSRRHVFEDIEVKDDRIEVKGRSFAGEEGEEEARVSICMPPKNALLLMRCRSDPTKMAALVNRSRRYENKEDEDDNKDGESVGFEQVKEVRGVLESQGNEEKDVKNGGEMEVRENDYVQQILEMEEAEEVAEENNEALVQAVDESNTSSFEAVPDQENTKNLSESAESSERIEKEKEHEIEDVTDAEKPTESESENPKKQEMAITENESESAALPECLLLMMREPKLSMEVSRETWVRGADFIRLLPERPRKPAKTAAIASGSDQEPVKKRPSIDSKSRPRVPAPPSRKNDHQPARSSCSLPAASIAAVIERNQVSAGKCEPFALTRCKSEPMSTAAAKLMPESCSWKNNAGMQLEPHRRASLGVGAAGVGF